MRRVLDHLPVVAAVGAGVAGVVLVEWLNRLTGPETSLTLLYLVPIALVTWRAGIALGLGISLASAAAWLAADLMLRPVYAKPASRYLNLAQELGVFVAFALILGSLRHRLLREEALARTDPLTRLGNRRSFQEAAGLELERARRHGRPFTVAYVDVDDFKTVNDRGGHEAGDAFLAAVARALRTSTRAVDVVARLGGDEFVLLLPETGGPMASALLSRLRDRLRATAEDDWPVTFSVGAVTFHAAPASVDEIVRQADEVMYSVKLAGKNGLRHEEVSAAPAAQPAG